ncbi:alanine racemase [Methylobacillus rhizosphaerae]|uniref:Alanine racemase n=1 Tax=Methylobacillus rhizosphaerae TaxID=551994 RepID=A0A238ZLG5_9PROT|nr:alanine racemase [Methylobacillus rhizosphaerae]SNR83544.1 alanine racemase [Methylobacillus rhizosphaerae]
MRAITATLNLTALRHNLQLVRQLAPATRIMAVVKADAYGHGLLRSVPGLEEADGFAVLRLSEALTLREAGYSQVLLLLEGVFCADELHAAAEHGISIVVHNESQLAMLEAKAGSISRPVSVFLKMNSGMNRLGFRPAEYRQAWQRLRDCTAVAEISLMTHFATADDERGITVQLEAFDTAAGALPGAVSLANSAAILRFPEAHRDWVRPGIMLYGASPVAGQGATSFGLRPAMRLTSEVIAIQTLEAGESLGYGSRFTATETIRIAVVACGYADGYPRHAPTGTPIAIDGQLSRTLGRVSMDMLFADVSHLPAARVGSEVELWGDTVSVDAVAEASGTVGYELLCAVAPRVPFKVMD